MSAPPRPTPAFVEEFRAAADSLAVAVAGSDLGLRIASCPGWTAYDLVVHLGNVHGWAATIVETGERAAEQDDEPPSPRPKAVGSWYGAKAEDLYQVLRTTPSDRPCWNFVEHRGVAGFWPRRQLHETTMHRVDLDLASGRTPLLDSDVAADGVGEVLGILVHRMHARGHRTALVEPLALSATDTGDTWVMVPQPGPPLLERFAGAVDVRDRVEAPADVLYRLLWQRPVDTGSVRVTGDPAHVQAFLSSRLAPDDCAGIVVVQVHEIGAVPGPNAPVVVLVRGIGAVPGQDAPVVVQVHEILTCRFVGGRGSARATPGGTDGVRRPGRGR